MWSVPDTAQPHTAGHCAAWFAIRRQGARLLRTNLPKFLALNLGGIRPFPLKEANEIQIP